MTFEGDRTSRYRREQLSFDVELHPAAIKRQEDESLHLNATVEGKLELPVGVNLNHGDRLVITIADEDGEALASSHATIKAPPTFEPIESKDLGLLGYTRVHKFKLEDGLGL